MLAEAGCHTILGKKIPVSIIHDSADPLDVHLMKPFSDNPGLSSQQQ